MDKAQHNVPGFGSLDHQKFLFQELAGDDLFKAKGPRVAMRRWMSWLTSMRTFIGKWHTMLLVLTWIGLRSGFYSDAKSVPLLGSQSSVAVKALSVEEVAKSESRAGDDNTDRKLQSMREKAVNTLHLVSMVLGDMARYRFCRILVELSEPVSTAHSKEATQMKGDNSVIEYYLAYSRGGYNFVLRKIFGLLCKPAALDAMGFLLDVDFSMEAGKATSSNDEVPAIFLPAQEAVIQEEAVFAEKAWLFALNLCRTRALSMSSHTHAFPNLFVLLLSPSGTIRKSGLGICEEAWTALAAVEVAALSRPALARLIKAIPWADWTIPREILLLLAQVEFKVIPEQVTQLLKSHFAGFGQSAIMENNINRNRDIQRQSKNSRLSDIKAWYRPIVTNVLGMYDRPEVQPHHHHSLSNRAIPKQSFVSTGCEPSIAQKEICKIMGKAFWTTTGAQGLQLCPSAWSLLQDLFRRAAWDDANLAWKAMFALTGMILQRRGFEQVLLVLASNQYAFIGWPIIITETAGKTFATVSSDDSAAPSFHHVYDFDQWSAFPHKICPPVRVISTVFEKPCVYAEVTGANLRIIEAAAMQGFKAVGQQWLEKLSKFFGWPWQTKEKTPFLSKVEVLIKNILPSASQAQAYEYMQARHPPGFQSWLHSATNIEAVDGVLESMDKKLCRDVMENKTSKTTSRAQCEEYISVAKSKNTSSGSGTTAHDVALADLPPQQNVAKAKPAKVDRKTKAPPTLDLARAVELLPSPATGRCFIQAYPRLRRHQVYYPREKFPRSCSRTWASSSDGLQVRDILKMLLRWAWDAHTEMGGEACPHDIASL